MSKYKVSFEEKVRIVKSNLSGEVGYKESEKAANNSEKEFREWVAQYRTGGAVALMPAVKAYLSGEGSLKVKCQRLKISGITTLSR